MMTRIPWWVRVPVLFFTIFGLMEFFVDSGDKPAFLQYPVTQLYLLFILVLLVAIELIVLAIENVMVQTLSQEARERYILEKEKEWEWKWAKNLYKRLTKSKAIEKEGEIILDHNYDGIRELDNVLPPWWVYLFYATMIFSVVYLVRYHILDGETQAEEYEQEVAEARRAIEEYKKTARDLIDVNTVELLTEATDMKSGQTIFEGNCAVCHKIDGGGSIGPNLTDDYWILGGGIRNVFNTVAEGGRDGKGMVAWKTSLKPLEMAQVASYVLSLHGTTPVDPKEPEGELYIDPLARADDVEVEVDSSGIEVILENDGTEF